MLWYFLGFHKSREYKRKSEKLQIQNLIKALVHWIKVMWFIVAFPVFSPCFAPLLERCLVEKKVEDMGRNGGGGSKNAALVFLRCLQRPYMVHAITDSSQSDPNPQHTHWNPQHGTTNPQRHIWNLVIVAVGEIVIFQGWFYEGRGSCWRDWITIQRDGSHLVSH